MTISQKMEKPEPEVFVYTAVMQQEMITPTPPGSRISSLATVSCYGVCLSFKDFLFFKPKLPVSSSRTLNLGIQVDGWYTERPAGGARDSRYSGTALTGPGLKQHLGLRCACEGDWMSQSGAQV